MVSLFFDVSFVWNLRNQLFDFFLAGGKGGEGGTGGGDRGRGGRLAFLYMK